MKKRVTFTGKPPASGTTSTPDDWIADRAPRQDEPNKRLTIDLPASLHRRVKRQCALGELAMAEVIREFLDKRFPPDEGRGGGS